MDFSGFKKIQSYIEEFSKPFTETEKNDKKDNESSNGFFANMFSSSQPVKKEKSNVKTVFDPYIKKDEPDAPDTPEEIIEEEPEIIDEYSKHSIPEDKDDVVSDSDSDDDNDSLRDKYTQAMNMDIESKLTVNIVLYFTQTWKDKSYTLFLLQKTSDFHTFPSFIYDKVLYNNNNDDHSVDSYDRVSESDNSSIEELSPQHVEIVNQCISTVIKMQKDGIPLDTKRKFSKNAYIGYIQSEQRDGQ